MVNKKFLRGFFGIPNRYRLVWAVIVETDKDGAKSCRLGLLLDGTPKVLDVMKRRFVQCELLLPVKRVTYPAKKRLDGKYVQFDTLGDVHETVRLNRSELDVEYFTARFSPELMETFVF
ncbi:MAG: hypothetical protein IJ532_09030 [Alphaproteobacteria bacterium]|nr:hypothetical protein [Alphaproteobacteria bacterium]